MVAAAPVFEALVEGGGQVSMTDEVKAAAERLVSNCWDTYLGSPPRDWVKIFDRVIGDGRAIALHCLVEHPADDAEPVTEDWLRAVGFEDDANHGNPECLYLPDELGWPVSKGVFDEWFVYGTKLLDAAQPKNRGDVRRLCAALGVPLKSEKGT